MCMQSIEAKFTSLHGFMTSSMKKIHRNGRCDRDGGRKGTFEKGDYSSLMVHTIEAHLIIL